MLKEPNKITVIIPCYKRFKNFETVLKSWLGLEAVDQVIVFDNSGSFTTDLPVLVLSSTENLGPQAKYACIDLAKNDLVIFVDDDVIAKQGLIPDLLKHWDKNKIVGVLGRRFTGTSYYTSTMYNGLSIGEPVKVDYLCGFLMMLDRKGCAVDIRDCPSALLDDWWFQRELSHLSLWVIPTKNYHLLPEATDEHALHLKPELKKIREEHYIKWILKGVKNA